jgi:hypothetical protein
LWVTRQSHLDEVKGFLAFHLLRGPERDDHVLYSSHTELVVENRTGIPLGNGGIRDDGAVVTKLDIPEEARKELGVDEAVSSALEPENRRSALPRRSARS